MMMCSTILFVTLTAMVAGSCEHPREGPKCGQLERKQQMRQQQNHHKLLIMQNFPSPDLPVLLQHAIAACCSIIREYYVEKTNSFMLSTNIEELRLQRYARDFINNLLICVNTIKVEIENIHGPREPSFNRKYNLIVVDSAQALRYVYSKLIM